MGGKIAEHLTKRMVNMLIQYYVFCGNLYLNYILYNKKRILKLKKVQTYQVTQKELYLGFFCKCLLVRSVTGTNFLFWMEFCIQVAILCIKA